MDDESGVEAAKAIFKQYGRIVTLPNGDIFLDIKCSKETLVREVIGVLGLKGQVSKYSQKKGGKVYIFSTRDTENIQNAKQILGA